MASPDDGQSTGNAIGTETATRVKSRRAEEHKRERMRKVECKLACNSLTIRAAYRFWAVGGCIVFQLACS